MTRRWTSTSKLSPATSTCTLRDLFPAEFARERMDIIRDVLGSREPKRFTTHWRGQWLHTTVWPVLSPERAVLVLIRPVFHAEAEKDIHTTNGDLGSLARLNTTERLVLAGIGEGWSTAEIAVPLHRSKKTIEWYRGTLGRKLNCSNRVELARIALLAGMSWERAIATCDGVPPK
jgi:DNA-binding CsgD family transcriptional regulator